ncbi:hypothetical protein SAY86_028706 [Trapa natans]|uniref:Uncharacterized protein n=1 Tax=Trapa natans TaxID=22666 RepID=A0AAN7M032_TRANT|nr:hypothetical protein SAY86_028706 [Trapa natans]
MKEAFELETSLFPFRSSVLLRFFGHPLVAGASLFPPQRSYISSCFSSETPNAMHGEEDHQPNPGPCLDAQAKSPEILTLETSAPLTLAPPDHGPQKAQVFQEFMQIDVDADPQFHTPNSPQASSQEAVADVTHPSASIFRPGLKGKKHGSSGGERWTRRRLRLVSRSSSPSLSVLPKHSTL